MKTILRTTTKGIIINMENNKEEFAINFTRDELMIIHKALMSYEESPKRSNEERINTVELWKKIFINR